MQNAFKLRFNLSIHSGYCMYNHRTSFHNKKLCIENVCVYYASENKQQLFL
jgi:hypothetical protein